MSLYIVRQNKVITMNRGDSCEFKFKFNTGKFPNEEPLIINEGDVIFFGLMDPNVHFEHALVKKEFNITNFDEEGYLVINFEPDDTLELMEGTYFYQIKLLTKDANIKTLVPKTKFIIVD